MRGYSIISLYEYDANRLQLNMIVYATHQNVYLQFIDSRLESNRIFGSSQFPFF